MKLEGADDGLASESTEMHSHVHPPKSLTRAGNEFFRAHLENVSFIFFITQLATRADEVRKVATQALLDTSHDETEKAKYQKELDTGDVVTTELRRYRQLIFEVAICRGVDNFLTYLSSLLAVQFRTRPEMLRSSEMVRVDAILQHDTMLELIKDLAERKVDQLSYQGMRDLNSYCDDRWSLQLFPIDVELERAVRLIEVRNIVVHNRAVMNRTFLSRVHDSPGNLGQRLEFEFDAVFSDLDFLAESVTAIDSGVILKYGLETTDYNEGRIAFLGPPVEEPESVVRTVPHTEIESPSDEDSEDSPQ